MKRHTRVARALIYILLLVASLIMVIPILTVVVPIVLFSGQSLLDDPLGGGLWQALVYTLARCAFYVGLALLVGLMGGYIFSKLRFAGRDKVFLLFLSGMIMPAILMIVPNFIMMAWFPLVGGNNILGQGGHGLLGDGRVLFVFGWVPPFAIFLMKQAFDMLPNDYQDAARLDGAGEFTIIFRVYAPLLKPALAALAIITFVNVWNDFLWPSVTLSNTLEFIPIALHIDGIFGATVSGPAGGNPAVAILLQLLVPVLVFIWLQRYFVQGLTAMAPKG
jgi:multiple sugar transport system permease protein